MLAISADMGETREALVLNQEVEKMKNCDMEMLRLNDLLNVKVELSGRHLAMNLEFRRKSGPTYKYLVLRPNEREEV